MLPPSSSPAMRAAMRAIAPEETPAKTPSSSSSLRVQTIASRLETMILRSSRVMSMIGGMKPSSSERRPSTNSPCIGSAGTSTGRGVAPFGRGAVPPPLAAGAEAADEGRHLVELVEDLDRGAVVVGARVGLVAVLVGHVVPRVLGHLQRHLDCTVGALGPLRVDDLRPVHREQLGALLGDV